MHLPPPLSEIITTVWFIQDGSISVSFCYEPGAFIIIRLQVATDNWDDHQHNHEIVHPMCWMRNAGTHIYIRDMHTYCTVPYAACCMHNITSKLSNGRQASIWHKWQLIQLHSSPMAVPPLFIDGELYRFSHFTWKMCIFNRNQVAHNTTLRICQ